jgi:hypothetical protein
VGSKKGRQGQEGITTKGVWETLNCEWEWGGGMVADPHHVNADPAFFNGIRIQLFYFNADADPAFHFHADPDQAPLQRMGICDHTGLKTLQCSILSLYLPL